MQIDMHFYGTYALARAAGLPPDVAKTVATAAQFVDDAIDNAPGSIGGESYIVPVVSSHQMLDVLNTKAWDQWQVWVPFHFLPGGQGSTAEERLLCRKGTDENIPATRVLQIAEECLDDPHGWHLLGIVSHVIQDTFSHWGFSGISSAYNQVEQGDITLHLSENPKLQDAIEGDAENLWEKFTGSLAEDFSSLGHGSVATYPDRPYLEWEYDYEMSLDKCPRQEGKLHVKRNNPSDFLESCKLMFGVYASAAKQKFGTSSSDFSTIERAIHGIIKAEQRKEGRIAEWKNAIATSALFTSLPEDRGVSYNEKCWDPGSLLRMPKAQKIEAQNFFRASRNYRGFIFSQVLPGLGLI